MNTGCGSCLSAPGFVPRLLKAALEFGKKLFTGIDHAAPSLFRDGFFEIVKVSGLKTFKATKESARFSKIPNRQESLAGDEVCEPAVASIQENPTKEGLHVGQETGSDPTISFVREEGWSCFADGAGWNWDADWYWDYDIDGWVMQPRGSHVSTLIWLHSCCGRPAEAWSFVEDDLRRDHALQVGQLRVVGPAAPYRGDCGDWRGWFEYTSNCLLTGHDQDDANMEQLQGQRERLLKLLEAEISRLPPDGHLLLGGFSQGASMALDVLLHAPQQVIQRIGGVVSQRGMLQNESVCDHPDGCAPPHVPILATHGDADSTIPVQAARGSYRLLDSSSFTFRQFLGLDHGGYMEAETSAITDFVAQHLCLPPASDWR